MVTCVQLAAKTCELLARERSSVLALTTVGAHLASPEQSVSSVIPSVYHAGDTGVRIEDDVSGVLLGTGAGSGLVGSSPGAPRPGWCWCLGHPFLR
jgi:hypothetical protein